MNDKQKQTLLIVMFIGILSIIGVGYYHFMFGRARINQIKKSTRTVEADVSKLYGKLRELESWAAREDEMEDKKAMISKVIRRLPTSTDAPGFLSALLQVLRSTGIIQEKVKSEPPQARAQYTEIPYSVKAFGRYHELGQFLTLIEQNPDRFMRVKSMTITNNLARPSIHPIDMQIKTFTFAGSGLDTPAPAAQP